MPPTMNSERDAEGAEAIIQNWKMLEMAFGVTFSLDFLVHVDMWVVLPGRDRCAIFSVGLGRSSLGLFVRRGVPLAPPVVRPWLVVLTRSSPPFSSSFRVSSLTRSSLSAVGAGVVNEAVIEPVT